jgi:hypothetical protein
MEKSELIERITNILKVNGCFSVGELEYDTAGISVGTLGNYVGLAEYFTEDYCEVNVYEPRSFSSDSIDTYEEKWENLSEDVLSEIHFVCEQWEAECIRTEKRICN